MTVIAIAIAITTIAIVQQNRVRNGDCSFIHSCMHACIHLFINQATRCWSTYSERNILSNLGRADLLVLGVVQYDLKRLGSLTTEDRSANTTQGLVCTVGLIAVQQSQRTVVVS
jgi:hypothetical protein